MYFMIYCSSAIDFYMCNNDNIFSDYLTEGAHSL